MKFSNPLENERGAALVIALMFLGILAMLGATAVVLTTTDIQIGANYKKSAASHYYAEAGINYAVGTMEAGLANGSFTLPTSTDPTVPENASTLTYTVPSGFSFAISDITMLGPNAYSFTSTGIGPDNAQSVITVTFKRESAISFAAFGNQKLDTKNGGTTMSYNSQSSDPTQNNPSDPSFQSTHDADVGSNDWLVTHNGATIDGSGVLGEKPDGSATTNSINGGTIFYDTTPVNEGRIDPDPLGVNSGGEYDPSTYVDPNNNNNLANPPIVGDTISLGNGDTMTLHDNSGADANYYLTSISLGKDSILTIDTTAGGNVNIFLTGALDTHNQAQILMVPNPYDATKFSIFSNSTSKIDLKHGSLFTGLIYAPYAPVDVKNSAAFYGSVWGGNVDIKNSGTVYFDSALKDKYPSNSLTATTWRDVRS
jgi:Tfp pilus assembly protein PilX